MAAAQLFYEGYDPRWILGRDKGPPVEAKPKPKEEPKKEAPKAPAAPPLVELKVPFCCEGCVEKMTDAFYDLDGFESVRVDADAGKVTISGKVKAEECLKLAKKIVRRSELWPKKKEEKKEGGGDGKGGGEKKDEKKK
ncbi:hypothetical protein R1sor_012411 [Riccia sorocarpa]|uniref:HMA domain-containing protein n=1 Tax=Riccia sorocarpa TaxID=122646 RepID=A0ABD3I7B2_9MARC